MKGTRLNEILSSLTQEEFIGLKEFLQSPSLNKNKQVNQFYSYLVARNCHPEYLSVGREEIFEFVYGNEEFNLDKYLKLSSDFVKVIERYLLKEFQSKRKLQNDLSLLEIARKRNLQKTFSKYQKECHYRIEKDFNKNLEIYLADYDLKVETAISNVNKKKFDLEKALLSINDSINKVFIISKLEVMIKLGCLPEEEDGFVNDVLKYISGNMESLRKKHPMIYVRYLVYKMNSEADVKFFNEIRMFLKTNRKKLSNENLKYINDKLLTFCSSQDADEYKEIEYSILKSMDESNLLIEEDNLSYISLLKIIDTSLSQNDSYWAENFLKKNIRKINEEFKSSTENLAMAAIEVYRHNYESALEHISKVSFLNDYFYLSSKALSLIIFYEIKDKQSINFTLDAFKVYLYRNKSNKDMKHLGWKNFLKYFKMIVNHPNINVYLIKNRIEKESMLINKKWLLREINSKLV